MMDQNNVNRLARAGTIWLTKFLPDKFGRVYWACLLALLVLAGGQVQAQDGYVLKGNDSIALSFFDEPDMNREVKLTHDGEASFPFIGAVNLKGMTLRQAEEKLLELYKPDYFVNPKLNLNLISAAFGRITVFGAVQRPGAIDIPQDGQLNLLEALAAAGGLSSDADQDKITLKRGEESRTYSRSEAQGVKLKAGDLITIGVSEFAGKKVIVTGLVQSPSEIAFPPDGNLTLESVIARSGGIAEGGDPDRITIRGGGRLMRVKLSTAGKTRLRPGEVVEVPQRDVTTDSVTVIGLVNKPGQVPLLPGQSDLLSVIVNAGGFARLANKKEVLVTRTVRGRQQTFELNYQNMARGRQAPFVLRAGDRVTVKERIW